LQNVITSYIIYRVIKTVGMCLKIICCYWYR